MQKVILINEMDYEIPDIQGYMAGDEDYPVTDLGILRAKITKTDLPSTEDPVILTSPLQRCRMAAEEIFGSAEEEEDLRDAHLGLWQGCGLDEIQEKWPKEYKEWLYNPVMLPPEAETFEHRAQRLENVLLRTLQSHSGDVVVFTHSGIIVPFLSRLQQIPEDKMTSVRIPYGAVSQLEWDGSSLQVISTGEQIIPELSEQLEQLILEKSAGKGTKYLFIDEVQNVSGFEEIINSFRNDGGYSIFITGSNSYLLSGELATKLTGRYVEFELFTLTFDEYEAMKSFYGKQIAPDRGQELANYLQEGGFPRALQFDDPADKRQYVQSVVQEIFEKDIRTRARIRDREAFEAVRNFIINNFGATTSIKKLHEELRKNGLSVTRLTVNRYIQVLLDAKILYECDRFDMKSKKSLKGEKKYYLSDLSFYFCDNTDNRVNYGPVLENITYFYAKSRGYSVSVGRIGTLECDFILRNRDADYAYLQVAYTIAQSKETEDREYRPLERIRDNYPKYLLTRNDLIQHRSGIKHCNIAPFMKENRMF